MVVEAYSILQVVDQHFSLTSIQTYSAYVHTVRKQDVRGGASCRIVYLFAIFIACCYAVAKSSLI